MKYNCLIVDDEKVLADSTAEYFNLFGVTPPPATRRTIAATFSRSIQSNLSCSILTWATVTDLTYARN